MAVGFPKLGDLSNIRSESQFNINPRKQNSLDILKQIAQSGFSPEQLNLLIQQMNQQLGASQRQERQILGQQLAGAPRGVQQSALASSQNRLLSAQQRGTTAIQAKGIDRQMQSLLALLQNQMQQQQIKAQQEQQLLGSLLGLGAQIPFLL